jgi:outer membrane protein assembly factor BamB
MQYVCRVLFLMAVSGSILLSAQRAPRQPAPSVEQIDGPNLQMGKAAAAEDAVTFTSTDNKFKGWKVVIPGNRPLATPAVVDGRVYIGGGFGSHEFYAFDAETGKKLWQYQTGDDGPTAAVVQDGYVGFNTESCELEILTVDGKPVWKKWLGDPLMSIPAIGNGKVYMAYPDSKGDHKYYLACFDVKTGDEKWKKSIASEIITTPVLADNQVYLATLEGTLYCFQQDGGQLVWTKKQNATSSPVVFRGECYFSRRKEVTLAQAGKGASQQFEALGGTTNNAFIAGLPAAAPGAFGSGGAGSASGRPTNYNVNRLETKELAATERPADYLDAKKRVASSKLEAMNAFQDSSVGFGGQAKGSFAGGAGGGGANIGQSTVAGVWAYQGSKPFVWQDRLYSSMGDTLTCVDPRSEKVQWKKTLRHKNAKPEELLDSTLTPPALVNGKVFLGTTYGHVLCLDADSGEVLWTVNVGEPIQFQPAVAKGRVFVSTSTGHLYCLETGDPKDDGWLMWGANAGHNGLLTAPLPR